MDPKPKKTEPVSYSGAGGWRDLTQGKTNKITTGTTFLRWLRDYSKGIIMLLLCLGLGFYVNSKLSDTDTDPEIASANESRASYLSKVLFKTSGVLDEQWLSNAISIRQKKQLMAVDIFKLKMDLENYDQVLKAEVTRVFPESLKIDLIEETPLLKIKLAQSKGDPIINLVSLNGIFYEGFGYSSEFISELPYLIPYRRSGKSYDPVVGIERLALLMESLAEAQIDRKLQIKVVSLENFPGEIGMPGQIIEIRTRSIPRILFGGFTDFDQQIKRLQYILSYLNGQGNPEVERIDLSLIGSAAVQFKEGRIGSF
jgi:hypothetical protein